MQWFAVLIVFPHMIQSNITRTGCVLLALKLLVLNVPRLAYKFAPRFYHARRDGVIVGMQLLEAAFVCWALASRYTPLTLSQQSTWAQAKAALIRGPVALLPNMLFHLSAWPRLAMQLLTTAVTWYGVQQNCLLAAAQPDGWSTVQQMHSLTGEVLRPLGVSGAPPPPAAAASPDAVCAQLTTFWCAVIGLGAALFFSFLLDLFGRLEFAYDYGNPRTKGDTACARAARAGKAMRMRWLGVSWHMAAVAATSAVFVTAALPTLPAFWRALN